MKYGFAFGILLGLLPMAGVPQGEGDAETVIAEIEGFQLTRSEFAEIKASLPDTIKSKLSDPAQESAFLKTWMLSLVYEREALAEGLQNDPKVKTRLEIQRVQQLASAYTELVVKDVEVTEQDMESFYSESREIFKHPTMVRLKHIVVSTRDEAIAIYSRLQAGEDFEQLARAESKDVRSRSRGGRMGWVRPNQQDAAFEQVAFGLEVGETSRPFMNSQGWQILQAVEKRAPGYLTLEDIRDTLKTQLLAETKKKRLQEVTETLEAKYGLKIYEESRKAGVSRAKPQSPQ